MPTSSFELVVKSVQDESSEYRSIFFHKTASLRYKAGDCFTIDFPNEPKLGGKEFSFASSPTEKEVCITYKKGISDFKKRMQSLRPGDKIKMSYYGSQFIFHPEKTSIFFAGGIGIAPFRGMIKELYDTHQNPEIILLYLHRSEVFPFRSELNLWKESMTGLRIEYMVTSRSGRLNKEKLRTLVPNIENDNFVHYIAGPPSMIDASVELLQSCGVKEKNIHTDSFDGYNEDMGLV